MSNHNSAAAHRAVFRPFFLLLLAAAVLVTSACNEPDESDGVSISEIPLTMLPPDVTLSLSCADMGVFNETCVLDDTENPYINAGIREFNVDTGEESNKSDLVSGIPEGPAGAKSRVYFWSTALARRQNGENQYNTALALHELYTAQAQVFGVGDPIVANQALRAYRSLLDNFFSSAFVFACFFDNGLFVNCSAGPGVPALFAVGLNELVACNLYFKDATATKDENGNPIPPYPDGFERFPVLGEELACENAPTSAKVDECYQFAGESILVDWGYAYQQPSSADFCGEGEVSLFGP